MKQTVGVRYAQDETEVIFKGQAYSVSGEDEQYLYNAGCPSECDIYVKKWSLPNEVEIPCQVNNCVVLVRSDENVKETPVPLESKEDTFKKGLIELQDKWNEQAENDYNVMSAGEWQKQNGFGVDSSKWGQMSGYAEYYHAALAEQLNAKWEKECKECYAEGYNRGVSDADKKTDVVDVMSAEEWFHPDNYPSYRTNKSIMFMAMNEYASYYHASMTSQKAEPQSIDWDKLKAGLSKFIGGNTNIIRDVNGIDLTNQTIEFIKKFFRNNITNA